MVGWWALLRQGGAAPVSCPRQVAGPVGGPSAEMPGDPSGTSEEVILLQGSFGPKPTAFWMALQEIAFSPALALPHQSWGGPCVSTQAGTGRGPLTYGEERGQKHLGTLGWKWHSCHLQLTLCLLPQAAFPVPAFIPSSPSQIRHQVSTPAPSVSSGSGRDTCLMGTLGPMANVGH